MKKDFTLKDFLNSKIFFVILVLFLSFSFIFLLKELKKTKKKEEELTFKKEEITKLKEENKTLEEKTSEKGLDFLKEREARLELGLKKPGENVVIIVKQSETESSEVNTKGENLSNPVLWWTYFFKKTLSKK